MSNGMTEEEKQAWREKVRKQMELSDQAARGRFKDQLKGLLSLSREEIDEITPDDTDVKTYDKLIAVVREALAANVSQAELCARIEALGALGVRIAKKVGSLAMLFA